MDTFVALVKKLLVESTMTDDEKQKAIELLEAANKIHYEALAKILKTSCDGGYSDGWNAGYEFGHSEGWAEGNKVLLQGMNNKRTQRNKPALVVPKMTKRERKRLKQQRKQRSFDQ